MSYSLISAQIKSILDGISSISVVYGYEAKELAEYPAATVSVLGHNNDFYDTGNNRIDYQFVIRIYSRLADASDGETKIMTVADDLITQLNSNLTLNGTCDWSRVSAGKAFYAEREIPVRGMEFTLVATKRVSRN